MKTIPVGTTSHHNHHLNVRLLLMLFCALLCLGRSALAQVTLPFEDHFNYTEGTALGATGGGNTSWTLGNSIGGGGLTNRGAAALSYPGLGGATGLGVIIPQYGGSSRTKGVQFSSGTFGAGNPTLYASFLVNVQTAPTSIRLLAYFRASTGGGTPHAGIFLTSSNTLHISKNSTTPIATPAATLSAGTHLVVLRYKWTSATAGDDEVAIWVDPGSLGAAEGSVPAATQSTTSGSDQSSLVNFTFQQTSTDSGVVWVDEVRLANTWSLVTPSGCTPPTPYAVNGGGAYCSGGSGVSVGLASSDSGIDYQLRRNGSDLGSPLPGTGAALDFGLQTLAGNYTVVGSNTTTSCVGVMIGSAAVTINTAPALTSHPSNIVVCASTTAGFSVGATGSGLSYQWQVDTGGGFANVTTGTGGTSANYTTASLTVGDSGSQYHCLVSGTCSPAVTSGSATVTVSSGASINSNPSSQTVSVGSVVTLTTSATGPSLSYQWQFSTDNGSSYNNVTTGTGGTTASYTTAPLTVVDSGTIYKCVVMAACGAPAETTTATITVKEAIYRSLASGIWTDLLSWQQSYNSGGSWVAATTSPTAANTTNITVLNGHVITVTNALSVDDLTIQAGGEVDASGATITVNDGPTPTDCTVFGTLRVAAANSSVAVSAGAGLTFGNGGTFVWNSPGTVNIPTATWADGSLCEVQNGTTTTPTGLGQSFYDFYWNKTSSGAVNLGGTLTTIRNDLRMRGSSDFANSVRFLMATGVNDVRVGRDVIFESGNITAGGGSAANTVLNLIVGRNLTVNSGANFDSRSSAATAVMNVWFTNTSVVQQLDISGGITHSGTGGGCPFVWNVAPGATLKLLVGNLPLGTGNNSTRDSVVVDGTLNFNTNQLTGPGILTVNATGTVIGNSTNQLTSGLYTTAYAGTLNLPGLPTLQNGDEFKLFDATVSYNGSFSAIVPTTPGLGLVWATSSLTVDGVLKVSTPIIGLPTLNQLNTGSSITLSWTGAYKLQSQTNNLTTGLSNNWFDYPGGSSSPVGITINPAHGSVFFRLINQ